MIKNTNNTRLAFTHNGIAIYTGNSNTGYMYSNYADTWNYDLTARSVHTGR
jgi:hypothetical protein